MELGRLDEVRGNVSHLRRKIGGGEPDVFDKAALGAFLHSFYNGIENIFIRIAKAIDLSVPTGRNWHRELLERMTLRAEGIRIEVISRELYKRLLDYMGFRHIFRHSYSGELDWERMKRLVVDLDRVFERLRREMEQFIEFLWSLGNG
ncbi:MAG: ribonuclease toxin HepT-like protein [bacterium]